MPSQGWCQCAGRLLRVRPLREQAPEGGGGGGGVAAPEGTVAVAAPRLRPGAVPASGRTEPRDPATTQAAAELGSAERPQKGAQSDVASVAMTSTVERKIAKRTHQRRGDTDGTFDDPRELEHYSEDRRPLSQHDAKKLGENSSLGRGRASKFATELKTSAETSVISHKVVREPDPTRASLAKKRSAVMLEMDTSAVAERRYTPSASTSQDTTILTMHEEDKSVAPAKVDESENCAANDQGHMSTGFTNESWQVDAVKQKLSALALSVVPDLQEILQLGRAQQIEAQQATRAQLALAEEVQQLRHELRVLSAAFDRRVPEPPKPGAGWTRMTHGAFRSADFPHGREYWQHEDGTTSWERPAGVPTPVEEMQNRKLLGAGTSEKRTNLPGEVNGVDL